MRLLQHNSQAGLQPVETSLPIIDAINANAPFRRLIKTAEQFRDRALAPTCFADQCDALSSSNTEIEILQHRSALRIGERRPIEDDFADSSFDRTRIQFGTILYFYDCVQQAL